MSLDALKTKARKATLAGKYDVALKFYSEIHKEDSNDLRMYTKLAEMKEKTGDVSGAIKDYTQVAKRYADDGFIVQAIAINKLVLRLDPEQTSIKEKLKSLSTERGEDWALSTVISSDISQANPSKKHRLERTPLISGLTGQELDDFIESLELQDFSEGDFIYNKGDSGDTLYIVGMGSIHLQAENTSGKTQVFSELSEGDFFGEIAFMSNKSQVGSAIAKSDGSVLLLNRKVFDEWVKKHPSIHETIEDFYRRRVLARLLAITPVFEKIPAEARTVLAKQFTLSFYKAGDEVIREGDIDNTFFLIRSGKVKVFTTNKKDLSKSIELGTLTEGDFFGEVAMLTKRPRTATVVASGPIEVMTLTGDKFLGIAKEYPSVKQVAETYLKQRVRNTIQKMNDQ